MIYENLLLLRNAIIERAIDDYKDCVVRSIRGDMRYSDNIHPRNMIEIEAFFRSRWCAALLNNSTTTGPEILETLHEWRDHTKHEQKHKSRYRHSKGLR